MKKDKNIKSYTAAELKAKRAESRTDLSRVDAITDAELERLVAEDEDERGIPPDWTQAKLVLPQAKQSVHLRLERDHRLFQITGQRAHFADASGSQGLCGRPQGTV